MPGEVWAGGGRAWAGGSARAACTARGPGCEGWRGARVCGERTKNMKPMVVTLDVSKLSGWLNADAPCRVERRACDAGREMRAGEAGGREAMMAQAAGTRGRF